MLRFEQKSRQNEVNIPYCAFKSGNIYLDELVYTGQILKFEIPKYKQIIQQKLKLSENHPSKDWINSSSYEYGNTSARRGAQFVLIGMPTICWKIFPLKLKHINEVIFSVLVFRIRMFLDKIGSFVT